MTEAMRELRGLLPLMQRISDDRYSAGLSGWPRIRFELIRRSRPVWRPVKRTVDILTALGEHGAFFRSETGLSRFTQFRQMMPIVHTYGFSPADYYTMLLFEQPDEAPMHFSKREWGFLLEFLLACQKSTQADMLDDKLACDEHYLQHGLPTTKLVAVFENGRCVSGELAERGRLPKADLFSKPTDARLGIGATRWMLDQSGAFRTLDGAAFDEAAVIERLERQSKSRTMLLQKREYNHPAIEALLGPTFANARIFTLRPPGEPAELLGGFISVPAEDIIATNHLHEEVYLCPVNDNTGRVSAGVHFKIRKTLQRVDTHPNTGQPIEGFQVPFWDDAVNLCTRAHDTFDEVAVIGWDIGFTKDGPLIIEGNRTPGGTALPTSRRKSWGRTRFPEVYLQYLRVACPELFQR